MDSTKRYFISNNTRVACVQALSFPEGIKDAWDKVFATIPSQEQRKFYGISYGGENGKIIYRAGAEKLYQGEAEQLGLETFIVKQGEYIYELLEDWRKDETQIGKVFNELLNDARIDKKEGYCLEIYFNATDVLCLVKLDPSAK